MRVPISWLRDFVDVPDDIDRVTATLDDLGLVVEGIERTGAGLEDVVVVRVLAIDPIKGADRIRLATVTDGTDEIQVVCGAWNYEVGSLVPLAPVGASLPNGMEIARRTMRGVTSNGMLCSGRELGVSDDQAGLLVLDDVDGAAPGRPILEVLGIIPDVVLDVAIEGNRPDAWSIEGIARDLAARLSLPFAPTSPHPPAARGADASSSVQVAIEAPDLCGRFFVTVLTDVEVKPSPAWVARRLELAGMRAINNVVDASNYVMLELGQPSHPYDLDAVAGRRLVVRKARHGERLELLDGSSLELAVDTGALGDTGEDLVICDGDDHPIGLAGVMGGAAAEISASTRSVALEVAWFDPMAVARSAKRHRTRTEASARFERGADPGIVERAAARFVELVCEDAPSTTVSTGSIDVRGVLPVPPVLRVAPADIARILGIELPTDEVRRLLVAIGFDVELDGEVAVVTAPSGRPDVRDAPYGVADVAEEVARLHGYASLPRRAPTWPTPGGLAPRIAVRRRVRDALVGIGALEVWTASLVAEDDAALVGDETERVRLTNPMSAGEPVLRSSLLPGLLGALRHNTERRQGDVAMFEVGVVFTHPAADAAPRLERGGAGGADQLKVPGETERVSLLLARPGDDARTAVAAWRAVASELRLSRVRVEGLGDRPVPHGLHATRCALLVDDASGAVLGALGEVDPHVVERAIPGFDAHQRLGWLDCSLLALADPRAATRRSDEATVPSRFPTSDVDLALVVAEAISVDEVKDAISAAAGGLCESVSCFDAYRGPGIEAGSRSLALRVRLGAADRTLSDAELTSVRAAMIDAARAAVGATLR